MERPRPGIGAELVPLLLITASLAGTVLVLIAVQRRQIAQEAARIKAEGQPVIVVARPVEKQSEPKPKPAAPKPAVPAQPVKAPEDPTVKVLAGIHAELANETTKAAQLGALIDSRRAKLTQVDQSMSAIRSRIATVQSKLDPLLADADRLEMEAARASIEVDVLERRREEQKQVAERAGARTSYAILPHKGPNGTWRRPIVIECHDGQVSLRPNGPTFGLGELLDFVGYGNSTFRGLVAREAIRIQRGATPDGKSVVPYFYFLIRPEGIKAYYAARRQLEPLGIAFGYELADADWELEYPNLDDPSNWQESSLNSESTATIAAPGGSQNGRNAGESSASGVLAGDAELNPFVWPADAASGAARGGVPSLPGETSGGQAPNRAAGPGLPGSRFVPELSPGNGISGSEMTGIDSGPAGGGGFGPQAGNSRSPGSDNAGTAASTVRPEGSRGESQPAGPGEAVVAPTESERQWAQELIRRGFSPKDVEAGALRPGRIGEILAENGLLPPGPAASRLGSVASELGGGGASGSELGRTPGGQHSSTASAPNSSHAGPAGNTGGATGTNASVAGSSRVEGFEIVIACERRGVAIHPGDYRVTLRGLAGKEPLLTSQLQALVAARRDASPGKLVVPSIKYLVEPGGHGTYTTARTQVALDGINWPSRMEVSGGDVLRGLSREDW